MDRYLKNLCDTTDVMGYISRIDNYDMLHVSDYLLKCLNITEDDYKGQKCHFVIHGKTTPCQFCNNSRLKVGEYDKWYAYNPLMDAHLAVRDTLIEHEEFGKVRMEICYEITNEVKTIKDLQASESYDKAVGACAKTLLDGESTNKSINDLLKTLCNFFGGEYSCIIENHGLFANVSHEFLTGDNKSLKDRFKMMPINMIENWYEFSDNDDKIYVDKKLHDKNSKQYKMLEDSRLDSVVLAPLRKDGVKLGSIVVGNPKNNLDDVRLLKTVSAFVVNFIEKQRLIKELKELSYSDILTGLKNRNYFESQIKRINEKAPDSVGIIFCDVNGLKEANDNLGHEYGDILIKWSAKYLSENIPSAVFRIGGDEFVSFVENVSREKFEEIVQKINEGLSKFNHINISVGHVWNDFEINIDKQLIDADKSMYEVKQNYYANKRYNHMNLNTHYNQIKKELERLKDLLN